jgi:hypothetical protein
LRLRFVERARFRFAATRFTLLRFEFFFFERLPLMAAMSFFLLGFEILKSRAV